MTVEGLTLDFRRAVNDYLGHCKTKNLKPEKPFSGTFNVRLNSELHRLAVFRAKEVGISLNAYIKDIVSKDVLS